MAVASTVSRRGWRRPPRHADDHPRYRGSKVGQGVPRSPAGRVCFRPGGSRGLCAKLAQQVPLPPPHVLFHLGQGRRFRAKAPRHQPEASSACPLCQGPPPAAGGPVPGPDGGLGNNGGDRGHPSGRPRGPGLVHEHKGQPQQRRGLAVITSHPVIVAQAVRPVPRHLLRDLQPTRPRRCPAQPTTASSTSSPSEDHPGLRLVTGSLPTLPSSAEDSLLLTGVWRIRWGAITDCRSRSCPTEDSSCVVASMG